jgi:hypothetical protein
MRTALIAGLVGSTALALGAIAQTQPQVTSNTIPQGEAQAKAAVVECDRLLAVLESSRPVAGVTAEQARRWKQDSQPEECRSALERVTQASKPADGGPQNAQAQDQQEAASPTPTSGAAATPRIVVQQAQPSVTVRQGQPEIIVRMPPPVITVQQAQPEIIVRMPEPDVNVAVARPDVQVTIPQPQVQVEAPRQQTQTNVQVERQQPNVRVERMGEPQIVYEPAEGQPQIRFEPMGAQTAGGAGATTAPQGAAATPPATQQAAQAQLNATTSGYGTTPGVAGAPGDATKAPSSSAERPGPSPEPSATGALPSPGQQLEVAKLSDMTVYTARNEKLGDVDSVVAGPDGKVQLVIGHGGFLGLGERKVLMPLEQLALREDRLVAEHLTDEQIKALPEFEKGERFRELEGRQTAPVRVLR